MIKKVILLIVGIIMLGALIPALWPTIETTSTTVENMTATSVGGLFIKSMWPVILIVAGIGIGAFLIFWALKQLHLGQR